MELTVRYFAGASAAAGLEEELVEVPDGATVDALAGMLAQRHGGRLARVLASSTFLVDEVPGGRERALAGARCVDVLPPVAGGETDLRALLRAGASDAEIADAWRGDMWAKRPGHGIDDPAFLQPARPMSAIGG